MKHFQILLILLSANTTILAQQQITRKIAFMAEDKILKKTALSALENFSYQNGDTSYKFSIRDFSEISDKIDIEYKLSDLFTRINPKSNFKDSSAKLPIRDFIEFDYLIYFSAKVIVNNLIQVEIRRYDVLKKKNNDTAGRFPYIDKNSSVVRVVNLSLDDFETSLASKKFKSIYLSLFTPETIITKAGIYTDKNYIRDGDTTYLSLFDTLDIYTKYDIENSVDKSLIKSIYEIEPLIDDPELVNQIKVKVLKSDANRASFSFQIPGVYRLKQKVYDQIMGMESQNIFFFRVVPENQVVQSYNYILVLNDAISKKEDTRTSFLTDIPFEVSAYSAKKQYELNITDIVNNEHDEKGDYMYRSSENYALSVVDSSSGPIKSFIDTASIIKKISPVYLGADSNKTELLRLEYLDKCGFHNYHYLLEMSMPKTVVSFMLRSNFLNNNIKQNYKTEKYSVTRVPSNEIGLFLETSSVQVFPYFADTANRFAAKQIGSSPVLSPILSINLRLFRNFSFLYAVSLERIGKVKVDTISFSMGNFFQMALGYNHLFRFSNKIPLTPSRKYTLYKLIVDFYAGVRQDDLSASTTGSAQTGYKNFTISKHTNILLKSGVSAYFLNQRSRRVVIANFGYNFFLVPIRYIYKNDYEIRGNTDKLSFYGGVRIPFGFKYINKQKRNMR